MIDWVDLVMVNGRQYVARLARVRETVAVDRIEATVAVTRCRIASTSAGPGFVFRDGDASFLPPGTELHAIHGVPVAKGLAARERGEWVYFAAQANSH